MPDVSTHTHCTGVSTFTPVKPVRSPLTRTLEMRVSEGGIGTSGYRRAPPRRPRAEQAKASAVSARAHGPPHLHFDASVSLRKVAGAIESTAWRRNTGCKSHVHPAWNNALPRSSDSQLRSTQPPPL